MPSQPLVAFQMVAKSYQSFRALRDVSFELNPGEIFGYIGPNGAGKTTTLKLLVGLLREFEGTITVDGHRLPKGRDAVHQLIGYLPQAAGFQHWRTVNHALMTLGQLSGVAPEVLMQRIPELLARFDLAEVQHKKIRMLSGGMQQKVGFVQALLHKPRLLVLDEPLAGLDPASRARVKQVIRELRSEGTTVIFSSHILSDVQDVADRIGIIDHGRMLVTGTVDELKDHFGMSREIEIEFAGPATDGIVIMEAFPPTKALRKISPGHFILELEAHAEVDDAIDQLLVRILAAELKIRRIGPTAPRLDDLYVRFLETAQTTSNATAHVR